MRIIAGDLARRRIEAPRGRVTRPTTDRVREALFQHLVSARLDGGFAGLRVLDLYAGSGVLGLEALSRGAASVTAIEADPRAAACVRDNARRLGIADRVRVVRAPLPGALARVRGPYDVVFADPPYDRADPEPLFRALAERGLIGAGGLVVYEHACTTVPPALAGEGPLAVRRYGDTCVAIYRHGAPDPD